MIKFAKAHAYGNDFLYMRTDAIGDRPPAALARDLCDRHTGIGADGLIFYRPTQAGAAMTLFNSDGSRAEVSGNGVRALAALLLDNDTRSNPVVVIQTEAGAKELTRLGRMGSRQTFKTSMGRPAGLEETTITVDDESLRAVVLNMGNPQCVLVGPLPDEDRFRRLGRAIEHHPMFPEGTNVEFAQVDPPRTVRILIWERGVGPTLSSGTGSCAALVASAAFGGAARDADVIAPGGSQRVEWTDDDVYLTGWAEVLCEGLWLPQFPRTPL